MNMLMGSETEFALIPRAAPGPSAAPPGSGGGGVRRAMGDCGICQEIVALARERVEAIPGVDGGLFLASGSRLYVDPTQHLELATCECQDPFSAVCALLAGERLCLEAVEAYNRRNPRAPVDLYAHNVDHTVNTSWGAHESYSYGLRNLDDLGHHLLPHLITRVIYTGAGGLDNRAAAARFMISPRARFFSEAFGGSTTGCRAIFNTRMEHHAENCCRLHVISGESLRSPRAMLLKLGVTALLTHMIDRSLFEAQAWMPRDPVRAFQDLAGDPTLTQAAPLADGSTRTALEIQMAYLQAAEAVADARGLPAWTPDVLRLWRETLEALANGQRGPDLGDWLLRQRVFAQACQRQGRSLEELARWAPLLAVLDGAGIGRCTAASFTAALRSGDSQAKAGAALGSACSARGVDPEAVIPWLELRDQLLILDARFSQVGGPWAAMALRLNGHTPGVTEERVGTLMREAPAGRAAIRGHWIRQMAQRKSPPTTNATADWDRLIDPHTSRWLDLSDAFGVKPPRWRRIAARESRQAAAAPTDTGVAQVEEIKRLYQAGRFRAALDLARRIRQLAPGLAPDQAARVPRFIAWCSARLGNCVGAIEAMQHAGQPDQGANAENYAFVYRYAGLIPRQPEMDRSLARAVEHAGGGQTAGSLIKELLGIQALAQDPVAARHWLSAALPLATERRIRARILGPLADAHRRLGDADGARACISEAMRIQRGSYEADFAEFTLAADARLDPQQRRCRLEEARALQANLDHPVGLARTLLLLARHCAVAHEAARFHGELLGLAQRAPVLRQCPRFTEILADWEAWLRDPQPRHGDEFWGV